MKRRIQAELSRSSSPESERNVHFLDNKNPETPASGWGGLDVGITGKSNKRYSTILPILVAVALVASCYSAWKAWMLNAGQPESALSAVAGYEMDQLFLTGRVANLEQKIQSFSNGLMNLEGREGMKELRDNLDALILTFGEVAMDMERHNERLVKVEADIAEIASLGERLGALERLSTSRQGGTESAQRQTTPSVQPKEPEPVATETNNEVVTAEVQSPPQNEVLKLIASPWIIMALSENSAFVRDKNTGQQHLLRVGTNTEACGNVTAINIADQELITEQCSPVRR